VFTGIPCLLATNFVSKLVMTRDPPLKEDIFFRMDSPVLVISATWHEISVPYGQSLRSALVRRYVGSEDSVSGSPTFASCDAH